MSATGKKQTARKKHFYQKKPFLWSVGVVIALIIAVLLAFRFSPWPGALVIRAVFDSNDQKTAAALAKHTPAIPIATISNQPYRSNDADAKLDVYFPENINDTDTKLPLVIWTHGGAWVSGDKDDHAPYFKLLAAKGFTVIGMDYSIAPEKTYPTAVFQLNDAYAYIQKNADRFHVDKNKIFLAGDSAGAQLSSQMAAITTNPAYAQEIGITPNLTPEQLKGVLLNCGIYKMEGLVQPDPTLPKIIGWGDDVSVWAYTGSRDFNNNNPVLRQMSAYYHVTNAYPAAYITGGNGDPLTDAQSKPFADKLSSMGVNVTRLFYDKDHQPSLPHEYQFNLDNKDGVSALQASVDFLKARSQ